MRVVKCQVAMPMPKELYTKLRVRAILEGYGSVWESVEMQYDHFIKELEKVIR